MTTAAPLTVIALCTALPGQEKVLRAAQEKLVAETLKEPGCLRYELNQSLDVLETPMAKHSRLWVRGRTLFEPTTTAAFFPCFKNPQLVNLF